MLRLLLIDDAGRPTVLTIASGAESEAGAADEAVVPEDAFVHSGREPGVVFKYAREAPAGAVEVEVEVEVERRPTALVVRTRSANGPWTEKVVAQLGADTAVRGAPFARGRYSDK